jgi:hypothetical protein
MGKQKGITINEEAEYDFDLYGLLLTDLEDFQIALQLNEKMKWNLQSYLPLEDPTADPPYKFHFFGEHNGPGHFQIALWKNWQNGLAFIPTLRNMQYFVRITGEWGELQDQQLLKALKEIAGSANAIKINIENVKSPEFFTFQIISREQKEERAFRNSLRELNHD